MLSDYQNLVGRLVRDDTGELLATDIDDAIDLAVSRYSKDRPDNKVQDVTSPGGQTLPLPAAWVGGFSDIAALEYPIGDVPPRQIERWSIYESPTGEEIQILESLTATVLVRVSFSIFHTLDSSTDTIPLDDREAVASYAASVCCGQLASRFAGDSDSTIQADSVEHGSKSGRFRRRADQLRKKYFDYLGIDPKANAAAGVVVDLDLTNSLGRDRLTHPNRRR